MKLPFVAGAVVTSGLCWYFANDLSGNYWYLLWFAPVPILITAFRLSHRGAFAASFIAYLLGRLSWLSYLLAVLPVPLAIFFTILLPVVFALVILLTRKIVLKNPSGWSALAFPVFWCLFEFLGFKFSPDGTAGSIAYTQSNFLPVVQTASVTGILGISFLATLFPSAIAVGFNFRFRKMKGSLLLVFSLILVAIMFGVLRMNSKALVQTEIVAGLAVIDEKFHSETTHPDTTKEIAAAKLYITEVKRLVSQGARVIVLPEKIVTTTPATDTALKNIFLNAASDNEVSIIAGYTQITDDGKKLNKALVISSKGELLSDYQKVNLFEGEIQSGFIPGREVSVFELNSIGAGVAICKDLDYAGFIRKYNSNRPEVMFVPAWDFVKDGWLHSRMAVMRGVENGYAVVRAARQGQLTISDHKGRILYEASSTNNKAASLVGKIALVRTKTVYSQFGDWFGYLASIAAIIFLWTISRRTENERQLNRKEAVSKVF